MVYVDLTHRTEVKDFPFTIRCAISSVGILIKELLVQMEGASLTRY